MANWMTAEAIAERYIVGEGRLLDYVRRGNLPCLRPAPGAEGGAPALYDESVCARFFRPRVAAAMTFRQPSGPSLGVLGVTVLGGEAAAPVRSQRHRSMRVPRDLGAQAAPVTIAPLRKIAG